MQGITQKKFRVGSPTFFSNPNINIPGLLDDMDGFSCSDSEDEDYSQPKPFDIDEVEDVGNNVRIEFRGRNLAEAIEDEEQTKDRIESLAKNQQEDLEMVRNLPWNNIQLEQDLDETMEETKISWSVLKADESFVKDFCQSLSPKNKPNMEILSLPSLPSLPTRITENDVKFGVLERDNDAVPKFSFDQQPNLSESFGPSPSLLLQALTMSNSNDVINLGISSF